MRNNHIRHIVAFPQYAFSCGSSNAAPEMRYNHIRRTVVAFPQIEFSYRHWDATCGKRNNYTLDFRYSCHDFFDLAVNKLVLLISDFLAISHLQAIYDCVQ